jgi:hypothetical protein
MWERRENVFGLFRGDRKPDKREERELVRTRG